MLFTVDFQLLNDSGLDFNHIFIYFIAAILYKYLSVSCVSSGGNMPYIRCFGLKIVLIRKIFIILVMKSQNSFSKGQEKIYAKGLPSFRHNFFSNLV